MTGRGRYGRPGTGNDRARTLRATPSRRLRCGDRPFDGSRPLADSTRRRTHSKPIAAGRRRRCGARGGWLKCCGDWVQGRCQPLGCIPDGLRARTGDTSHRSASGRSERSGRSGRSQTGQFEESKWERIEAVSAMDAGLSPCILRPIKGMGHGHFH